MGAKNASGFSLLQMIIALAIIGIIATVFMNSIKNSAHAARAIQDRGELEDLRRFIRAARSCEKTKELSPCTSVGQSVQFKRADGQDVFSGTGATSRTVGRWEIRVSCADTSDNYNVEVKKARDTAGSSVYNELFSKVRDGC